MGGTKKEDILKGNGSDSQIRVSLSLYVGLILNKAVQMSPKDRIIQREEGSNKNNNLSRLCAAWRGKDVILH